MYLSSTRFKVELDNGYMEQNMFPVFTKHVNVQVHNELTAIHNYYMDSLVMFVTTVFDSK